MTSNYQYPNPKSYTNNNKNFDQHYVWGWNEGRQLGIGHYQNGMEIVKEPYSLGGSHNFDTKSISIGMAHSLAIDSRGQLYSCGKTAYGRLGLGDYLSQNQQNIKEFTQIKLNKDDNDDHDNSYSYSYTSSRINNKINNKINNSINNYIKVNKISCGSAHSAFITENFQLFTFGKNDQGQLGQGLINELHSPKRVIYIQYSFNPNEIDQSKAITEKSTNYHDNVDLVACGLNHTVFSLKDGCVYSMGSNKFSQLGYQSTINDKVSPIVQPDGIVQPSPPLPLLEHRPRLIESLNLPPQHLEQRFTNIKSISCGSNFTVCIKQGNLYTWGTNNLGQCGFNPKENDDIITTTSSSSSSTTTNNNNNIIINKPKLLIIYGDKSTLSTDSNNGNGKRVFNFTQVSCGVDHCLALTNNGQVFGWGDNKYGQIGQLTFSSVIKIDTTTPIRIGESLTNEFITQISSGAYHSMALTKSSIIYAWGLNDKCQIGEIGKNQQEIIQTPCRVRFTNAKENCAPILQISAGGRSSMAIKYSPSKVDIRPSTYFDDILRILENKSFQDFNLNITDNEGKIKEMFKLNKLFWNRSLVLQSLKSKELTSTSSTNVAIEKSEFIKTFNDYSIKEIIQDLYIDAPSNQSFITTSISEYLFSMINQSSFSDVKIKVICRNDQDDKEVTKIFNAHKCLLVNRSEKFKTLLESNYFKESIDGVITIDDSPSFQVYETFLTYLYTDVLNLNNENVIDLFLLSHRESQNRMKDLIEEYLFNSLDIDNVSNIFELALQLNDNAISIDSKGINNFLIGQCIFFIAKNLEQVSKTESFINLSDNSKIILSSNSINLNNSKSNKSLNNNNNNNNNTNTNDDNNDNDLNNGNNGKKCIIC
ncbi:hypothetical protein DDB_G0269700 [Dictyostelium discoideum AX4]|uniref:BTB domain-containing protein n=1 Tax=Dictyostelium discoideum TaxID=44689 RepID=Q55DD2_DICDI|nr:hypothetical protein DDB_G0269700 [Dictyostelium discoideum AX4]EAL72200.1 hypothetical protein DDB_G0269700 [Dictyostelium discoideum AX4]|eukprot:XP_646199.1 hypothetical protein DDB_G0269700 [Dictyostelium discoideum AX4]